MAVMTYIEPIRDTLAEEMRRDDSIVVLGEDVGKKGGVFLATDGLYDEFGGDRVLDTPLSESMIVGVSIGAGVAGLRPVPEIQFADFIFPAFNQILSEAARMRYRSNGAFSVPDDAPRRRMAAASTARCTTRSRSRPSSPTFPGLKVVIPSTPYDARGLLRIGHPRRRPGALLRAQEDVSLRPRRGAGHRVHRAARPGQGDARGHGRDRHRLRADGALRAGGGRDPRRGGRLGRGRRPAHAAAARRRDACFDRVPQDRQGRHRLRGQPLRRLRRGDRRDPRRGSLRLTSTGPIVRVTGPDVPGVPYNHVLEDWFMPNPDRIADAVRRLAAY